MHKDNATSMAGSPYGYDIEKKSAMGNLADMGGTKPMGVKGGKKGGYKGDGHSPMTASVQTGLSESFAITEYPEDLGQGRDMYSGKPMGPEKRGISRGQKFG